MRFQYIPNIWFSIFGVAVSLFLAVYALTRFKTRGAAMFFVSMILASLWSVLQALEWAAPDLRLKIILANLQYLAIMYIPVTYLIMVLVLTNRDKWIRRKPIILILFTLPLVMQVLLWTNPAHGLIRRNVVLDSSGPFPVISKTFGPVFWLFAVYNYTLTFLSLIPLALANLRGRAASRKQFPPLFLGMLIPITANFLYLSKILPIKFDPTPLMFGISGVFISLGIFRYRLFSIIPVARSVIVEEMAAAVIVLDTSGGTVDLNLSARLLLGRPEKRFLGLPAEELFKGYPELLRLYKDPSGGTEELVFKKEDLPRYFEVSNTPLTDSRGRALGRLIMAYDITERKSAEELIRHMAFHDNLTGLPNREFFQELFSQEMVHSARRGDLIVLVFVDLDDFKLINDNYGHDMGDLFLKEVAGRLKKGTRRSDIISRLGGDEFTLILPGVKLYEDVEGLVQKIFTCFKGPAVVKGKELPIKASFGVSVYPMDGATLPELLKKADAAMYKAKKSGKNSFIIHRE